MSLLPRKKIVVPVDYSLSSETAIRVAIDVSEENAEIHVLNVIPPLEPLSPLGVFGGEDVEENLRRQALGLLETWLASREFEDVVAAIEVGNEGDRISEYAQEQSADLIAIPPHGHSGVKRVLLGSVTERVLRHAPCPVLVLRRV